MKMFKDKTQIRDFIKNNNIKTAKDIHDVLKDLFKDVLQEALESEINSDLGYQKYDSKNKHTDNSRNGYSKKSVISSSGKLELDIPRDRKGEFEPKIVKKYDRNISDIESKILALYARGNSTRDINCYLKEIYGVDVSADLVSRITDKIMPDVREWQNRPLDNTYAFVLLDAMFFNVREDGRVVKKAVYIVLGINLNGMKDVLGIYIGEAESSRFWLSVLNNIKERGLEDILIVSVDGLKGFKEAIETVYPKAEVQRCIVHQIRHSTRFVSYKDIKAFSADLKKVYNAPTEAVGLAMLDEAEDKWGGKYYLSIKSWKDNWSSIATMFSYGADIRKMMYTTNAIENLNRQYRKVTKTKSSFPTDESLMKLMFLVTQTVTKKWTVPIRNWNTILSELSIHFGDRVNLY